MADNRIQHAVEEDYFSRDPGHSKRASYIRRTTTKAKDWVLQ